MPLIKVDLFDYRMSDETSAALIEKLTDALCEATHPGLRDHTWVIVEGHSPKNWGLGGKPWPVDQMPPAPEAREAASGIGLQAVYPLRDEPARPHPQRQRTPADHATSSDCAQGKQPEPGRGREAGCDGRGSAICDPRLPRPGGAQRPGRACGADPQTSRGDSRPRRTHSWPELAEHLAAVKRGLARGSGHESRSASWTRSGSSARSRAFARRVWPQTPIALKRRGIFWPARSLVRV